MAPKSLSSSSLFISSIFIFIFFSIASAYIAGPPPPRNHLYHQTPPPAAHHLYHQSPPLAAHNLYHQNPPPAAHNLYHQSPPPARAGMCPMDAMKMGVCGNLLGDSVEVLAGASPCCSVLESLADLDAAVCLCTAFKAHLNAEVSLALFLNYCGKNLPTGFRCAGSILEY